METCMPRPFVAAALLVLIGALCVCGCKRDFPDELAFKCPCPQTHACQDGLCVKSTEATIGDDADATPGIDLSGFMLGEDLNSPTPDIQSDSGNQPDVQYSSNALLEFYEPYGDDDITCQGFQNPPENSHKIDHCYFELSYNQKRTFKVMYFEDGIPVPSQKVEWELINAEDESGSPLATIDTASTYTDDEGIAAINVTSTDQMGQFALKAAAVSDKFTIPPLYFDVVVLPKQAEPLTIKFMHEGAAAYDVVKAYLFLQDNSGNPLCAVIDPKNLPMADKVSQEFDDISQSWKVVSFPDLTPDNPLHYTVLAVAYETNGPPLAFGCDQESVVVEYGKSTMVTVVLKDVPPTYKGTYQVVNHLDMISALPDNIEMVVNIVIDFFNNPVGGLMEMTCVIDNSTLADLCETFFNDPDNPDVSDLTYIGSISSSIINAILFSLLEDNIGKDILFTGKDVENILRGIQIHAAIEIKDEPDATGFIPADDTEEEWHTVSFQWTLGESCSPVDPDCGLKSFSFNSIGQDVLIGDFDAQVDGYGGGQFDKLIIYPHSLNFKYGAFVNFLIEKLILPMIAGDGSDGLPVVDSYEKFLGSLMGGKQCLVLNNCCEIYAQAVSDQAGAWVEALLNTGCQALIPLGADYLRQFLVGLDADTGDAFTLATKDGTPCTLYDTNNDQTIDTWGKKEPEELRCMWDVLLKLGGTDVLFDASFWATKMQ